METSAGSLASVSYLILGATYAFAAAVQPGPLQSFLVFHTLAHGWRRTVPAVFAPILSDIPIICLVLLVLTHIPPLFVSAIRLAGGLFLLYLAFGAFSSFSGYQTSTIAGTAPASQTVIKATLVNLLNPNPYLAWTLVLGPLLLRAWNQTAVGGMAFLGAFYGTMVFTTAIILAFFAGARSFGMKITRILVGVSAAVLLLFGLYQVWSGATALIRGL